MISLSASMILFYFLSVQNKYNSFRQFKNIISIYMMNKSVEWKKGIHDKDFFYH